MSDEQTASSFNLLTDGEWLQLIKIIGLANRLNDDYAFRRTILEQLRILVPYESAAFFLTDLSKVSTSPNFFSSPIGIDCEEGRLEEYLETAWEGDKIRELFPTDESRVIRESDLENVLSRLNALRGPIAHCSILAEDEIVKLNLSVRDWFRLMG